IADPADPSGTQVSYAGHDRAVTTDLETGVQMQAGPGVAGFKASFFEMDHTITRLDDIDFDAEPDHTEVVSSIDYQNSHHTEFFEGAQLDLIGAKFEGIITIEDGGTYRFHTASDDGTALYIDGELVIGNDGLHSYRARSGDVELEPGEHTIELRYFENYGHQGVTLEVEVPGENGRVLVDDTMVKTLPGPELETLGGVLEGVDHAMGSDRDDTLMGTSEANHLDGGAGHDTIEGRDGDDVIAGGAGADELFGGAGHDRLDGGAGSDLIDAGHGDDVIVASDGADQIRGGDGIDTITYSELDAGIDVDLAAGTQTSNEDIQSGFRASFFEMDTTIRRLSDIDFDAEPVHSEVVSAVNYTNSSHTEFFEGAQLDLIAARFEGTIQITEGGDYSFFTASDDGTALYIDGDLVVGNDGLHAYREQSGDVTLEPGEHTIELRYFENYGHQGVRLEYEGPDTDGRVLVDDSVISSPGAALEDQLTGVENVIGTNHADIIQGDQADNALSAAAGDDDLRGGAGNDTLWGGEGNDMLAGGTGDDTLVGGDGDDLFTFQIGQGTDLVFGGGGGWTDAIRLEGVEMTSYGSDWTVTLDQGEIEVVGEGGLELSDGAAGVIEFESGGTIEFQDISQIQT
ncbi:MAG: PA14 domain-containing protein, partial [Pseudomonadota bacterium]